jgi:D-glycero-D-manno-heptose 1,7-bisphosphate phosphatase
MHAVFEPRVDLTRPSIPQNEREEGVTQNQSASDRSIASRRPIQAVILAGGRGTRLQPITDTIPKPMIRFHGRPFLEYLIEMLRRQGFQRVLLLLGYLPDVVQNYFGSGEKWGIQIEYSVSDADNETGVRLRIARPKIDPVFLLMYCDNYWPMIFDKMWRQYASFPGAQLTVYRNDDLYTRNNMLVRSDGVVEKYDRGRQTEGLSGVDIGFALFNRDLLDMIPDENVSFEQTIYPRLVEAHQLTAFVTSHRYYSVGSHDRLGLTNDFLQERPAVILDRDGVLNRKMRTAEYVRSWSDWEWIPGAKEAIAMFKRAGYRIFIVSNQAGIARGALSVEALGEIHEKMTGEIQAAGGDIDRIYICPHGWDDGCDCRKPRPGMLIQAQRDFSLDLTRTPFIGDDARDLAAAEAAGCAGVIVNDNVRLIDRAREMLTA